MERYIDIYILLLSCTCARAFVTCYCPTCEKPRFNDKFFLRRVFCSNLKRTCCFAFFFLEKCMRPATQFCNDELYSWFREWEKHPAKQPSYMGSPNGRPNAMASVASGEAFLLMECIKKCALHGRALKKNCKLTLKHLWPRVYSVLSETLPYTCRDFTLKKVRH